MFNYVQKSEMFDNYLIYVYRYHGRCAILLQN